MKRAIILFFICTLFIPVLYAETLRIELDPDSWNLTRYYVTGSPEKYFLTTGIAEYQDHVSVLIHYLNGSVETIKAGEFGIAGAGNPYEVIKFEVAVNRTKIISKNVSYCNFNNKCEPCTNAACTVSENAITCMDCNPAEDNVCEPIRDGICDPDCVNYFDSDCGDTASVKTNVKPENEKGEADNKTKEISENNKSENKQSSKTELKIIPIMVLILLAIIIIGYLIKKKTEN